MKQHLEEETELRRYLLGELAREEQVSVEARLFLDDEYLLRLKAAEDELVDDYAYGDLTADERERFETHFLSKPGRLQDLKIAEALKRYASSEAAQASPKAAPATVAAPPASDEEEPPEHQGPAAVSFLPAFFTRRPLVTGFALAALLILSLIVWLSVESARRQEQSPPLQAQEPASRQSEQAGPRQQDPAANLQSNESPRITEGETAGQQERVREGAGGAERQPDAQAERQARRPPVPTPRQPQTRVATFLLFPGGGIRGGGQTAEVRLAPGVGTVVLRLPLVSPGDYASYSARLQTGGRTIHTQPDLKPETDPEIGKFVSLQIPAGLLRRQSYRIRLGGHMAGGETREITSYTFRVERE